MKFVICIFILTSLVAVGRAQLAASFSNVDMTDDCNTWSHWGNCIWPKSGYKKARSRGGTNLYMEQLSSQCRRHWFYSFLQKNWGTALNNFFAYIESITVDDKPCGLCSFKQSCGFGGAMDCHHDPWAINKKANNGEGSRPFMPFYVSESLCCDNDLGGPQNEPCFSKYSIVKQNNPDNPCQIWPSKIPKLPNVDSTIEQTLNNVTWITCLPDMSPNKQTKGDNGRSEPKYCRCCCYPFEPIEMKNGKNYSYTCEKKKDAPEPPVANKKCKITGYN